MNFSYYYGNQAEQFSFIKIPKIMITDAMFSDLSLPAKVLYGLLLDRMGLSMKNRWFDSENRVYIIYQIADIQEDLGISKNKAIELLAALEKFGLIEKKRRGLGMPSLLYVKNFIVEEKYTKEQPFMAKRNENATSRSMEIITSGSSENETSGCTENATSRSPKTQTSRGCDFKLQEVSESVPPISKTKENKTEHDTSISNHIVSCEEKEIDRMSEYQRYEKCVRQNIAFDVLLEANKGQEEFLQGILDLIMEVIMCKSEEMLVAKNRFPVEVVRSRFLKLNYSHIQYVLGCLEKNTTQVKNMKKYLIATLFNAPCTMESYYQSVVNHDYPQYVL